MGRKNREVKMGMEKWGGKNRGKNEGGKIEKKREKTQKNIGKKSQEE